MKIEVSIGESRIVFSYLMIVLYLYQAITTIVIDSPILSIK